MTGPVDPRTPCVVGVAQRTWRPGGDTQAPEPLAMWAEVARMAAADAGATGDVLGSVGTVDVVHCMSWPYDDPPRRLTEALGISPLHTRYSGIGGTTTHHLMADRARQMLAGELDVALVVGGEALDTRRRLRKAGERPAWSHRHPDPPPFPFEAPFHPAEVAHEVFQAWLTFAVRDVARRAHLRTSPELYRARIGSLLAPMTAVAAANPHAWFPRAASPAELINPSPANRMVGYPYTKRTVAVMDVDMASALVMATWEAADRMGVPPERRVALRGWADALDATYVAEHPDLWRSPGMAHALGTALTLAGVGPDEVAHFDLYSCFAASVFFALDALGIDPDDGRGVTVTGGLPFAGGPASNYLGHATAAMVGRLREDPGSAGLVTGVGMHLTKHSAMVLSTRPAPLREAAAAPEPATIELVSRHEGPATIAAYSVVHDRDGAPAWGLLVCDVGPGRRTYARVEDPGDLDRLEAEEAVGAAVVLRSEGEVHHARLVDAAG